MAINGDTWSGVSIHVGLLLFGLGMSHGFNSEAPLYSPSSSEATMGPSSAASLWQFARAFVWFGLHGAWTV